MNFRVFQKEKNEFPTTTQKNVCSFLSHSSFAQLQCKKIGLMKSPCQVSLNLKQPKTNRFNSRSTSVVCCHSCCLVLFKQQTLPRHFSRSDKFAMGCSKEKGEPNFEIIIFFLVRQTHRHKQLTQSNSKLVSCLLCIQE